MGINVNLTWKTVGLGLVALLVLLVITLGGVGAYTSSSDFCGGSCHTMDEQYAAWKKSKHFSTNNEGGIQAECIDCHFLPGEKRSLHAQFVGLRHLFAYLADSDAPLPIRPVVKDGSCLQSGCHSREEIANEELVYINNTRFKHDVHLSEKALDGRGVDCETCHFKATAEEHFEAPKEICFLCHLKLDKPVLEQATIGKDGKVERVSFRQKPKIAYNEGVSKCDICHEIPTKSLQAQIDTDDPTKEPITHQTMQKAGVPCESCHFEVVKGHGEINTGNVVSNGCLTCHNRSSDLLSKAVDKKLMHDKHVISRRADCFDCHSVVEHKNQPNHYDFVRQDCVLCHDDQHKYQDILLTGKTVVDGVPGVPMLMDEVNTNCMACHIKKRSSLTGHDVRTGSGEACAGCHTEEHKKMLVDWKNSIEREVRGVKEVEEEALQAVKDAENKASKAMLLEAETMIVEGQRILTIVEVGNGVHNKKYSMMLINEIYGKFEDAIDLLDSGG